MKQQHIYVIFFIVASWIAPYKPDYDNVCAVYLTLHPKKRYAFLRKASMRYVTVGLKVNNKFSVSDLSLDLQFIARHKQ